MNKTRKQVTPHINLGNSGTATQTYNFGALNGIAYSSTVTGAHTIAFTGFPSGDAVGYIHLYLTNGGAHVLSWSSTVTYIKPDGSHTTSLGDYLAANTGRTSLKTSGEDQLIFWHKNGTTWGKLV